MRLDNKEIYYVAFKSKLWWRGGGTLGVTDALFVAKLAPNAVFNNLKGTPKRFVVYGFRLDSSNKPNFINVKANFNPTTGEIISSGSYYMAYSSSLTQWAYDSTNIFTIGYNSLTMATANADAYYWTLIYEY